MFQVQSKKCNQCLFSKNKIVSNKRQIEIIQECAVNNTYFICHKSSMKGGEACCRGWYDAFKETSKHIQMAIWLKVLKFVNIK